MYFIHKNLKCCYYKFKYYLTLLNYVFLKKKAKSAILYM